MVDIEKLDNELYKALYGCSSSRDYKGIWNKIKSDPLILREAVQVVRDRFDSRDIVKGLSICDMMLSDYKNVDEVAYNSLINSIYTNVDIARLVVNGASNGGYSFLLMSLWNENLKLTEEQKAFAVDEAMNKFGTVRWKEMEDSFSEELDKKGINNDVVSFIDIDGCVNPIGKKTHFEYMNRMISGLSSKQAHGTGEFDIRYYILKNHNWTKDEKQKLVMDFFADDNDYDEHLDQWEWGIINAPVNYNNDRLVFLDKSNLYDYTYDVLLGLYEDENAAKVISGEIEFCKLMHELRPMQYEMDNDKVLSKK